MTGKGLKTRFERFCQLVWVKVPKSLANDLEGF
jgi:hypothetical protein